MCLRIELSTSVDEGSGAAAPPRPEQGSAPAAEPPSSTLLRCWVEQREDLLRFCRRSLGRVDGDDAFSRATLSMLRASPPTGGLRRPAAWLQEVVRRACIDIHRERARRSRLLLLVDEGLGELAAPAAVGDPEKTFLERETLARFERAIHTLPPALRAALLLRARDELSYAEMAILLLESEENLRKRVQIARQMVRRLVHPGEESGNRAPAEPDPTRRRPVSPHGR